MRADPPLVPFAHFSALWIQVTGTWCNLQCTHCINASGPENPWLAPMATDAVEQHLAEAERLGVKEIYFTGGEPFLHRDIERLLARALAIAPTTVLTNGTAITPARADRLAAIARASAYSFEIRISVDDVDEAANDRVRGRGAFAGAVRAIRLLDARGLLPILTATESLEPGETPRAATSERFRAFLRALGIARPRVKILAIFAVGRLADRDRRRLSAEMLQGFDVGRLPCADGRAVTATGVYACPILAGLDEARLSSGDLAESFRAAPLAHPACVTCYETGTTCTNN